MTGSSASQSLRLSGDWRLAGRVQHRPPSPAAPAGTGPILIELNDITAMDGAGAVELARLRRKLASGGREVRIAAPPAHLPASLMAMVEAVPANAPAPPPRDPLGPVVALGAGASEMAREGADLVAFLGHAAETLAGALIRPARLARTAIIHHIDQVGLKALPIVALLSALIGLVLAYQGADQLRRFGAGIYVVNLLGIAVLRETGALMTAIIVAGRSGSAFAAELGAMQAAQEIDAMRTMGLDPMQRLVLPRLIALVVSLPLLTVFANLAAIAGGALMAAMSLDISFEQFMVQFKSAVALRHYWLGLVKTPVFALAIGLVGCFQGMNVSGSAASVGAATTRAVVLSIFLVIVIDAVFSVIFAVLDL